MRDRKGAKPSATQEMINSAAAMCKFDWDTTRISTSTWTFEQLSHFSHRRISPYVIEVARLLCSQFDLADGARRKLKDMRQHLLDTGDQDSDIHILCALTAGGEGLVVFSVCGILNEYFHPMAVAHFFDTLAQMSGMPESLRPAYGRWVELSRITARIQPPPSFHHLVRRFTLLSPDNMTDLDDCAGPIGVVSNFQCMASLQSGEETGSIIMFGGRSAGWCAAIAEWMFGLRIKLVVKDVEAFPGKTVYENLEGQGEQLVIAFMKPGIPCDGELMDDPDMPVLKK